MEKLSNEVIRNRINSVLEDELRKNKKYMQLQNKLLEFMNKQENEIPHEIVQETWNEFISAYVDTAYQVGFSDGMNVNIEKR